MAIYTDKIHNEQRMLVQEARESTTSPGHCATSKRTYSVQAHLCCALVLYMFLGVLHVQFVKTVASTSKCQGQLAGELQGTPVK